MLEAAALERQPSSGGSGGEEPPRKRRGAKPKYICATQEEAIAKRCVLRHHKQFLRTTATTRLVAINCQRGFLIANMAIMSVLSIFSMQVLKTAN